MAAVATAVPAPLVNLTAMLTEIKVAKVQRVKHLMDLFCLHR